MAVISGKCKWASVQSPETTFEPQYCIDVIVSDTQKAKLEAAGLKVKKDKDGDNTVKIRRKVNSKEGKVHDAPEVVDQDGTAFTKLIGNGSLVKVSFSIYDWEAFGSAGKNAWLNKVVVLEHVAYEGGDDLNFDDDDAPVEAGKEDFDDEQF